MTMVSSLLKAELTKKLPKPGMKNKVSTTNDPEIIPATAGLDRTQLGSVLIAKYEQEYPNFGQSFGSGRLNIGMLRNI